MRRKISLLWIAGIAVLTFVAAQISTARLLLEGQAEASAADPVRPGKSIARIWRGRTLSSKADEYERYLNKSGITKIRATPGNRGAYVLRRSDGDKTEFVVMSLWESIDAIKRFAGEDYTKTVILPKDREYLLEVEPNVVHYEVVEAFTAQPSGSSR